MSTVRDEEMTAYFTSSSVADPVY